MRFPALILVPVLALGLTAARAASLPDTGQDTCYDGTSMVACTNANTGDAAPYPRQDGRFGRDAKATAGTLTKTGGGAAGFDYSKIANNGSDLGAGIDLALGANPTDWACTRDNITGLTWEVKVNDASHLRHMDWQYTWYNKDQSTNAGREGTPDTGGGGGDVGNNCLNTSSCDTEKFVADVKAAGLCGYNTGWRMPTLRELLTLVHAGAGVNNITIDSTYFPNTNASNFWSGSSYVRDPTSAWGVAFNHGESVPGAKSFDMHVRLVRGGQF